MRSWLGSWQVGSKDVTNTPNGHAGLKPRFVHSLLYGFELFEQHERTDYSEALQHVFRVQGYPPGHNYPSFGRIVPMMFYVFKHG